jgi:hypothetical protein
VQW